MYGTSKSIHAIKTSLRPGIQCSRYNTQKVVEKKLVKTLKQFWAKEFQDLNTDDGALQISPLCNDPFPNEIY